MCSISQYLTCAGVMWCAALTCEAGSHLLRWLEELGTFQGAVSVHILPPLQVLSHGVLDLLSANPLHDLNTKNTPGHTPGRENTCTQSPQHLHIQLINHTKLLNQSVLKYETDWTRCVDLQENINPPEHSILPLANQLAEERAKVFTEALKH